MTSRERYIAAVEHRQPDRVPVAMLMAPEVRAKLKAHLRLDDRGLNAWLGDDLVFIYPRYPTPASPLAYADPTIQVTGEGLYLDIYRVPFRQVRTEFQTYMELAGLPPLAKAASVAELERFGWPTADWWDYSGLKAALAANAGKAVGSHSRGFFEIAHFMRGMDNFLADLALAPKLACCVMDHIIDHQLERSRRILAACGGGLAVFEYNDDVACQRGLMISPEMWRRHIKPRMKRFCDLIHSFGAKCRYHCCGSVRAILPELIEIGVEILTPIQPLAEGMDPFELKREFGKDLTLDGGIDIQQLLPQGSVAQVRQHVRRMIDVVGKDGGYVLGGSHSIQADTPVENVVAMIQEARM